MTEALRGMFSRYQGAAAVDVTGQESTSKPALEPYKSPMRQDKRNGLLVYRFETLSAGVDAFVSTRRGGVSQAPYDSLNLGLRVGDEAEKVVENRRLLFAAFELELKRSVWCRQIHADGVAVVGAADAGRGSTEEESIVKDVDALVTAEPGPGAMRDLGRLRPRGDL